jgi:uncharacterized damage-inducible protein DinB
MNRSQELLKEFDAEMEATRRVLARVPSEQGEWKPHPKSFSLAHLAQLVSWMPGWITRTLRETELDLQTGAGYSNEKTDTLLAGFDESIKAARAAIEVSTEADFQVPWSLKMGDRVLQKASRAETVRQHINHLSHHRGQLTVYLRMLDVPVPSVYGPTADEKWS